MPHVIASRRAAWRLLSRPIEMGALRRGVGRPRRRRNCEIRRLWGVVSIADMLPAPQINDVHRITFAAVWESPGVRFSVGWCYHA
jgi:hypothetical protein